MLGSDLEYGVDPLISGHLASVSFELMLSQQQAKQTLAFLSLESGMEVLNLQYESGIHLPLSSKQACEAPESSYFERAKQVAEQACLDVNFIQGDRRYLRCKDKYDRVFCTLTGFDMHDRSVNLIIIEEIANSLKVGGRLLLVVSDPDSTNTQPTHSKQVCELKEVSHDDKELSNLFETYGLVTKECYIGTESPALEAGCEHIFAVAEKANGF
ncbi:class I SAM-dependent methyltransferase [Pseudoalteromonas luteoviolacea]|uniref:Methyltransferase domain-containing protein n=1 Tax=Pseudoalteromonas luteoviolacea S4060-1 TaxID=1365257 RepID=A0A162B9T1_9GAMM|nr:class I SAM-dependent methyltransferase [Pseudoalteromonas luteoviolacea]KZN68770.1 hypothetical protein N478_13990 [Pseudoalteromonas luteoviolacea S4060-1]